MGDKIYDVSTPDYAVYDELARLRQENRVLKDDVIAKELELQEALVLYPKLQYKLEGSPYPEFNANTPRKPWWKFWA